MNDFDAIAPLYDKLAVFVFGQALNRANGACVDHIFPNAKILVLGGGTGAVLDAIDRLSIPCEIDYVEPSRKMIAYAQARKLHARVKVNFLMSTFQSHITGRKYDIIHAGFFLDLFTEQELVQTIRLIKQQLHSSGLLLVADFRLNQGLSYVWQKLLIRVMHFFFRFAAKLESQSLQPIASHLVSEGFSEEECTLYYHGMVFSGVYGLSPHPA